jgi:hypothetical protein
VQEVLDLQPERRQGRAQLVGRGREKRILQPDGVADLLEAKRALRLTIPKRGDVTKRRDHASAACIRAHQEMGGEREPAQLAIRLSDPDDQSALGLPGAQTHQRGTTLQEERAAVLLNRLTALEHGAPAQQRIGWDAQDAFRAGVGGTDDAVLIVEDHSFFHALDDELVVKLHRVWGLKPTHCFVPGDDLFGRVHARLS